MGKKATKASRKYAASGQLKKEIQARKKFQQKKRTIERRKGRPGKQNGKGRTPPSDEGTEDEDTKAGEDEEMSGSEDENFKGMSVDDFLKGGFMEGDSDDAGSGNDDDDEDEEDDDNASFASVDDLEDEAVSHKVELQRLAEKDPEFYKYLQENDQELLDFDVEENGDEVDVDEMDVERDEDSEIKAPTLTPEILRRWQKAILQHRSLRALRRLLIAFRAAVHMNEEDEVVAWTIDSPALYEKLVSTSLRYTPVVLQHHVPYKVSAEGKFKPPAQIPKLKTLQKLIQSYFHNVLQLISQTSAHDMLLLAVTELPKLVPYVISSRKTIKAYLKAYLTLWSSAEDDVRIAAFVAIRKLASSCDESIKDLIFKSTYTTLLRNAKSTTAHTLPSINLMKNSASEIFCADHASAYQHAFGYIRQLAIHLRNSMKVKTKEAFRQVYNWQYVHSIDFWAIVLARACSLEAQIQNGGKESELRALIYPLTQVALGAIKLIPSSRSFPFHLSLIRSLIHLSRHTQTYIPLVPYLLPIITSTLAPTSKPKSSTLKALDLETNIRAPAQYQRTRIYNDSVLEEAVYQLTVWLASKHIQGSLAFPELVVPLVVSLKKSVKKASGGKEASIVKSLLERVEEGSRYITERRKSVSFGPKNLQEVEQWERDVDIDETPLGKYEKAQRKLRERRRKLMEKAREGEEEYLEE